MAFSWIQVMTKCSRSCARYVIDRCKLADAVKCIDTGEDFPTDHPQPQATIAMGDLLVQFLEALADPVIPTVHHSACCAATTRDEAYACLDLLPHTNTNVGTLLLTLANYPGSDFCHLPLAFPTRGRATGETSGRLR